jgi:hypothetical protein
MLIKEASNNEYLTAYNWSCLLVDVEIISNVLDILIIYDHSFVHKHIGASFIIIEQEN